MFTHTQEQRLTINKTKEILTRYNLVYLAAQPRCGKTLMSMTTVKELGFKRVLFMTTKKAMGSIQLDLVKSEYRFTKFTILNWDQLLTKNCPINSDYDVFIYDEATILAGYPKPGATQKKAKELAGKSPVILMSGTPTPESYSQIFHQFSVSHYSPFVYTNFYKWAKDFVNVKQKWRGGFMINDYSIAKEAEIKEFTKHYMVTLSQKEAGFESFVEEEILYVDINPLLYKLMDVLKKKKIYEMRSGDVIIADTPVRLQSLFHQISSGTVITGEDETRKSHMLDDSKVLFIKEYFKGKKIAIYYQFIAEGELLRKHFPNSTSDPQVFNSNHKMVFICQFIAGRMGVNLSTADCLVAYNIGFSATTYFQFRERMQHIDRKIISKLYWIFSRKGIEKHIYGAVSKKKNFTESYFKEKVLHLIGT